MHHNPYLIKGGKASDDRGSLQFINDLDLSNMKRFYIVRNYDINFIRAWHAHKFESKYVMCLHGSAKICAVKIDNFQNPSKSLEVHKFFIDQHTPEILVIPNGFANGFISLEYNTRLIFFSDKTLKESIDDDYRYPFDYWNPWKIEFR